MPIRSTDPPGEKPGRETLGRLFMDDDGRIWEQIGYVEEPTVIFRRMVEPRNKITAAVASEFANKMRPLTKDEEHEFREMRDA